MKQVSTDKYPYHGELLPVNFYYKSEYTVRLVPDFLCTPSNLKKLCVHARALVVTCPCKYSCRQFTQS